ncbi:MAG: hypothetical protein PHF86_07730 [Candidatus Nanoarchaeia archaeon]|jgi:hypothetical protein|nr:hypothetical protein [Candidatus Nanoarchaeia archaeon]
MISKIIDEILKESKFKSTQKGDVSKKLFEQGFFDNDLPEGLKNRDKLTTGNPVDIFDVFEEQN